MEYLTEQIKKQKEANRVAFFRQAQTIEEIEQAQKQYKELSDLASWETAKDKKKLLESGAEGILYKIKSLEAKLHEGMKLNEERAAKLARLEDLQKQYDLRTGKL